MYNLCIQYMYNSYSVSFKHNIFATTSLSLLSPRSVWHLRNTANNTGSSLNDFLSDDRSHVSRVNPAVSSRRQLTATMSLAITVKSAANLPNLEWIGQSDPMTVLTYKGTY